MEILGGDCPGTCPALRSRSRPRSHPEMGPIGTAGRGGEERSGAAGVKLLVGMWGWAAERISEMF